MRSQRRTVISLILLVSRVFASSSSNVTSTDCRVVVGSRVDVSRSGGSPGVTSSAIISLSLHTTLPLDNFTLHLSFSDTRQPADNSSSDRNNDSSSFLNDTSDFVDKSSEFVSHYRDSFKYSSIRFLFTSSHKTGPYWQMFEVSRDSINQTTRRLPMVLYLSRSHKTILVLTPGSTGLRVSDVDGDVCWSLALGLPGEYFSTMHWWLECPARSYIVLHTCPLAAVISNTCNPNQDCGCLAGSGHSLSVSDHICSHFIWAWIIAGILAVLIVIVCAGRCRIRDPTVAATKRETASYSPQYLYNNAPESQLAAANTNLTRSTDEDMYWF